MSARRIVLLTRGSAQTRLVEALCQRGGQRLVGSVAARSDADGPQGTSLRWVSDALAPERVAFVRDRDELAAELARLMPELVVCWGFPWRLGADALDVAPLGTVNVHPSLVPRHRGPNPLAWAFRLGDRESGLSFHRMRADYDAGPVLVRASYPLRDDDREPADLGPRVTRAAFRAWPQAVEAIEHARPGEPQDESQASFAGRFGEDYAWIDWRRPAAEIHNQVRAWRMVELFDGPRGALALLDAAVIRVTATSLAPADADATAVRCGDRPLWLLDWTPTQLAPPRQPSAETELI